MLDNSNLHFNKKLQKIKNNKNLVKFLFLPTEKSKILRISPLPEIFYGAKNMNPGNF